MPSLVGGGIKPFQGSVACPSWCFVFDELAEFNRHALDGLRQPLETGEIIIARANHHVRYPARFQLIAAITRWAIFQNLPVPVVEPHYVPNIILQNLRSNVG